LNWIWYLQIPVWIAAKAITGGKASIGSAMAATVLGPIVYALVLIVSSFFLSALIGEFSGTLALILAFLAWLYIYKSIFKTGWLGALGIAILAVLVFIIISIIISILFAFPIPIGFF
jgi:hypothetical protein